MKEMDSVFESNEPIEHHPQYSTSSFDNNNANNSDGTTAIEMRRQRTLEEIFSPYSANHVFANSYDDVMNHKGMLEYPVHKCPANTEPFIPDVLCNIMLFVENDKHLLLSLSATCRMWRFYANYLPNWTKLQVRHELLPSWHPPHVVDKKTQTREKIMTEIREYIESAKNEWDDQQPAQDWGGPDLISLLLLLGLVALHYLIAWHTGIDNNALYGDVETALGLVSIFFFTTFFWLTAFIMDDFWKSEFVRLHYMRMIITLILINFVLFVPLSLVGGRVNSAEDIIYGGEINATARRQLLLEAPRHSNGSLSSSSSAAAVAPVRAFYTLNHSLLSGADPGRWRHFPTMRPLLVEESNTNTNNTSGNSNSSSNGTTTTTTVDPFWRDGTQMSDEGVFETQHVHWRTLTQDKGAGRRNHRTDFFGSFFIIYDAATKPNTVEIQNTTTNSNSTSSEWGSRTSPSSPNYVLPCYALRPPAGEEVESSKLSFAMMNCLDDVLRLSPEWAGTDFVAISGTVESFVEKLNVAAEENETEKKNELPTYRTVRRTAHFNSEYSYLNSVFWQHESNQLWQRSGIYLINTDWPETMGEAHDRVDGLLVSRNYILLAAGGICLLSFIIGLLASFTVYQQLNGVIGMLIVSAIVANPITMLVMGILCSAKTDDPRHRDEGWLMCQSSPGGSLLIGFGSVLLPAVAFLLLFLLHDRRRRRYMFDAIYPPMESKVPSRFLA